MGKLENDNMNKIIYSVNKSKNADGYYTYSVIIEKTDTEVLCQTVNAFLKEMFEDDAISEFSGIIQLCCNEIIDAENVKEGNDFLKKCIDKELLDLFKEWIEVTDRKIHISINVSNTIKDKFELSAKEIRNDKALIKKKNKIKGGCFMVFLKIFYYTIFWGGAFGMLLNGIYTIDRGNTSLGVFYIRLSIAILIVLGLIHYIVRKLRKKRNADN